MEECDVSTSFATLRTELPRELAPALALVPMPFAASLDRMLSPLDEIRRQWFAFWLRRRGVSSLLVRRERRLAVTATAHAGVTFLLSVYVPVLLFVVGPVVFGVAHVAADLRYLVLRQHLGTWWRRSVLISCIAWVLLRGLELAHVLRVSARLELGLVLFWITWGVMAGAVESRARVRAALTLACLALVGTAAMHFHEVWRLIFLHLHNLVGLAIWPFFYRSRQKLLLFPLGLILVGAAVLASGVFYQVSLASFAGKQFGLHILQVADWITGSLRADHAIGLSCAFVFLQGAHYAFWLNVIPQAEVRGQGTLTFRMSARALLTDFKPLGVLAIALAILLVVSLAFVNARRASILYMSLANFHGYLELVLLAYFFVAQRSFALHARSRAPSDQ